MRTVAGTVRMERTAERERGAVVDQAEAAAGARARRAMGVLNFMVVVVWFVVDSVVKVCLLNCRKKVAVKRWWRCMARMQGVTMVDVKKMWWKFILFLHGDDA